MRVSNIINYNLSAKEYGDVNVIISADGVAEFHFVVTLDRENGSIYDGGVSFARNPSDDFEEADFDIPADVKAAFDAIRPAMVEQLKLIPLLDSAGRGVILNTPETLIQSREGV